MYSLISKQTTLGGILAIKFHSCRNIHSQLPLRLFILPFMKSSKGIVCASVSSATFGLIPLFSLPVIATGMSINSVVFYRFFISAIAMTVVMQIRKTPLRITKQEFFTLLGLSLFYAATSFMLTLSYTFIPSGIATTIHFLYPVFVTLIMIVFYKEKGSFITLFAIALAMIGVALLSISGTNGSINITGLVLALITVVTYGTYLVHVQKSMVRTMDSLKITLYLMIICSVIFFFHALMQDGTIAPITDIKTGICLFLLALLPTVVSNMTLVQAVKNIGPTITSILGCLEPLTAVTIGIIVFNEGCNITQCIGIGIVSTAVVLIIVKNTRKEKSKVLS